MIVYWSLFLAIILIQLFPASTDKGSKVKLIISFLLMFAYAALRGDFANDYKPYEDIFNDFNNTSITGFFELGREPGYIWLNKLMPSYRALLVLLSAFTCFTYYWMFRKFIPLKYYWLGFVLMALAGGNMLFFQLTGLRNAIAINIMTLSVLLIKDRKILLYFGFVFLAYLFHNSVVFFMPLAFFFATPAKIKIRTIVILALFILLMIFIPTASLNKIVAPFINTYFERYSIYVDKASEINTKFSLLMSGFMLITLTMTIIILLTEKLTVNENIIIKLSLLFLISFLMGALNMRMTQYFAPYLVIAATVVMYRVKNQALKYAYLISVISYLAYSFLLFVATENFLFSKYYTFFK